MDFFGGGRGADDLTVQQQQNSFGPDLARHFLLIHFNLIWNLISSVDEMLLQIAHIWMNVNDRFADAKTWKQMRDGREQWNFSFLFFFCFVGAAGRVLVMTTWLCSILLLVQLLVLAVKRAASHFGGPGCGQKKKKKEKSDALIISEMLRTR